MTRSAYKPSIAAKFCAAVAEGDKSIRTICKMPGMPSKATVFRWLAEHEDFQKLYELAKDEQAETFVDEVVEIADNAKGTKIGVAKAKLQIYARIEAAQKMKPRKYGRQQGGGAGEGDKPEDLAGQIRALVAAAGAVTGTPDENS
ncbi:hypothetical protein IP91_00111 [Pseudoduganella lurida]|uniref:Ubiquitin carboxyl-hydrolase n=1 Tax=Pseudoduganella lurida TaxID=1036180 RepID=A0A562RKT8_9BURK|nr:ubiquitin carboxyl-hydrolase [Pseudoduganella lurida]TWI69046.1 hypothetical protein IP91_00111 [Pseudoduganella lurida]